MPILELTSRERSGLRSAAHPLKPVVLIGDKGLSVSVLKEIDSALTAHGLIKVRAGGEDRDARDALLAEICESLSCAPVHHLGKILILYRPQDGEPMPSGRGADREAAADKPAGVKARKASEPHTPKKMAAEGKKLVKAPRRRAARQDEAAQGRPEDVTGPRRRSGSGLGSGSGSGSAKTPARPARDDLYPAARAPRPSTRKTSPSSTSPTPHGIPRRAGSALSLRAGARRAPSASAGRKTTRSIKN